MDDRNAGSAINAGIAVSDCGGALFDDTGIAVADDGSAGVHYGSPRSPFDGPT